MLHTIAAAAGLLLLAVGPAQGQSGLLRRAREKAEQSGVARSLERTALEAQMLGAPTISLEESSLPTVPVGALSLGIAEVDIVDGEGIRLRAYLFNPGTEAVQVPLPDAGLFVLVDARGRRLELLGGPDAEGQDGAPELQVPALERVSLSLLFGDLPAEVQVGTLKVGTLGMIGGIPLHTGASPAAATRADGQSPWSGVSPPPPPPDTVRGSGPPQGAGAW